MPIWTLSPFKVFILHIWFVVIPKGGQPASKGGGGGGE